MVFVMAQILCFAFQKPLPAKTMPTQPREFHVVVLTLPSRLAKLFQHNPTIPIVKCSTLRKNSCADCPILTTTNHKFSGPPFVDLARDGESEPRRSIGPSDLGELSCKNACQDQSAARFQPVQNPIGLPD